VDRGWLDQPGLDAGAPPHKVAQYHGHDIALMMRVYVHSGPDAQTGAAADALFG